MIVGWRVTVVTALDEYGLRAEFRYPGIASAPPAIRCQELAFADNPPRDTIVSFERYLPGALGRRQTGKAATLGTRSGCRKPLLQSRDFVAYCLTKSNVQGRPTMPRPVSRVPVPAVSLNYALML